MEQDFLARRENVDRLMVVREKEHHTQISVVEDNVLVEHYVSDIQEVQTVGNIYLGRVQNVLPSMEAAFVDIGQARNGVPARSTGMPLVSKASRAASSWRSSPATRCSCRSLRTRSATRVPA